MRYIFYIPNTITRSPFALHLTQEHQIEFNHRTDAYWLVFNDTIQGFVGVYVARNLSQLSEPFYGFLASTKKPQKATS